MPNNLAKNFTNRNQNTPPGVSDGALIHSQKIQTMTATATKVHTKIPANNLGFAQNIARKRGVETMMISPGLAKSWLSFNTRNRKVNEGHVSRLAESMNNDNWSLNGQSIIFSSAGVLLDGQHRLLAIVKHGFPVEFDVRFGIDPDAMMTIDEGKKRTAADVLQLEDVKNATAVASACKLVMKYDNDTSRSKDRAASPTNIEVFQWLNENRGIIDAVSTSAKYYGMAPDCPVPASKVAGFMFICNRSDKELSEQFFFKLSTGVGLKIDGVVFKLRNRLNQAKNGKVSFTRAYVQGLMATAWNHYVDGNSPGTLKYTPKPGESAKFK